LKRSKTFFIKINMRIMSITPTKQTIFIHNFIFYEKILTQFKTLKEGQKYITFLKNRDQTKTREIGRRT